MSKELKIEETTNYATLEQAITEGGDALIPFEFEYPNTDLIVEVGLKPLTLSSIPNAGRLNEEEAAELIVKQAMFNMDGAEINPEVISKIPIGVLKKISDRISEISGFNLDDVEVDKLKQFP